MFGQTPTSYQHLMSFLDQIREQQFQLRHVEPVKNKQPATSVNICTDDAEYERLISETGFERYYDLIKDLTFESWLVPLASDQIDALITYHDLFRREFKESALISRKTSDDPLYLTEFTAWKDDSALRKLVNSIDMTMKQMRDETGDPDASAFVRLSTLSPKDAVVFRPDFPQRIREAESWARRVEQEQKISFATEVNRRIYAIGIAGSSGMRVLNGEQAVQLLVESERTHQEFTAKRLLGDQKELNIVVRHFRDFDPGMELRCFVVSGRLVAVSQYNNYVFSPLLVAHRDKIKSLVQSYFNDSVLPILQTLDVAARCTVDIMLGQIGNSDSFDIRVIEVNPFAEFTGTCLFSLEDDSDLFFGGRKGEELEFRIVQEPPPFARQTLENRWAQFL